MHGGTVMLSLTGLTLSLEEQDILKHPQVGGVILFSRNYQSYDQLQQFINEIRQASHEPLLIAVDQEGGRVQRFREEFSVLPPLHAIGAVYDESHGQGISLARNHGWLMAAELRTVGVDISFAPVLDLAKGVSSVIGDRSFHKNPDVVATLASAYIEGMNEAGMAAVGKHFPGHGSVSIDSHLDIPFDERSYDEIAKEDLIPFQKLAPKQLAGIMPAHIMYPQVDHYPVGFSKQWLQIILRANLKFTGVIFSDDLTMAGAAYVGNIVDRARTALIAGCDQVLICNDQPAAITVLENLQQHSISDINRKSRVNKLFGKPQIDLPTLKKSFLWQHARSTMDQLLNKEK